MQNNYPEVQLDDNYPLQHYYRDGNEFFSVARLVDASKGLPVFDIPLAAIDLSYTPWSNNTMLDYAQHFKQMQDADLEHPIILDWNGSLADGRHRVIKAIVEGRTTVKAVRLTWRIAPDRVDG